MLVQLLLTVGLALIVSALTVHFRDIKDLLANLLTFWFFATPIIYPMAAAPEGGRRLLNLNPFTHLAISYQEILFYSGSVRPLEMAAGAARRVRGAVPVRVLPVRPSA